MKKLLFITVLILILTSFSVLAIVGHPAAQIFPGLFATGNYSFDGNVGIGTSTPASPLDVKGNTTSYAGQFYNANSVGYGLYVKANNALSTRYGLYVTNSANNPSLIVRNDGNVGIGTNSPGAKLEIYDGGIFNSRAVSSGGYQTVYSQFAYGGTLASPSQVPINSLLGGILVYGYDGSVLRGQGFSGWWTDAPITGVNQATWFVADSYDSKKLVVSMATGNVGIGTTSIGTYKLNVAGSLVATDYYSGDGTLGFTSGAPVYICSSPSCSSYYTCELKDGLVVGCS